jgi:hypothetical protein
MKKRLCQKEKEKVSDKLKVFKRIIRDNKDYLLSL